MHNMNISIQEIENGVVLNINHDGCYPGKSTYYGSFPALLQNLMRQVNIAWARMEEDAKKYSQPAGNESILSRAYSQYNALSENEKRIWERMQAGGLELAAEQKVVEEQYSPSEANVFAEKRRQELEDMGKCKVQEGMKEKQVQNWRDKLTQDPHRSTKPQQGPKHVGPEDFDNERGGEG